MAILGFTSREAKVLTLILVVIFVATFVNLLSAERRARDFQRKEDLNNIVKLVEKFQDQKGSLPLSAEDGRILACNEKLDRLGNPSYEPCPWGDVLFDERIPVDPQNSQGVSYRYISNGRHFQIYGSLESAEENEYNPAVVARNLPCGIRICNIGRGSTNTPVDKSLEEYENELRQKAKNAR